jgi:hypothetical protein
LNQNDGIDFAQIAEDIGGNPGSFGTAPISIGTLNPEDTVYFWVKVTVPSSTTPAGNPRQFNVVARFTGT